MSGGHLEAKGVDTYYGQLQILHGLDLDMPAGKTTVVIGPNGAGKSTALKALFGLVPAKRGTVTLDGEDITNRKPRWMVRNGVCFIPQGRAIFPTLSVAENLRMGAAVLGDAALERDRAEMVYQRFPRLEDRRRQVAGSLSGGEQQMLALGRALMVDPQVLLVDEPSVGLAPQAVDQVMDSLQELRDEGKTLVIVEQNATMALQHADQAYVLVMGRNRLQGTGKELLDDPQVREIYLGGGTGDPDKMGSP